MGPVAWLRTHGKSLASAPERQAVLEQMAQMITEGIEDISAAQAKDRVVPPRFDGTAKMILGAIKYYQDLIPRWMEPEKLEDTTPAPLKAGVEADWAVMNEPKGVCINIAPWNAPVTLALIPALGMLAAGNHVVIKPADLTPEVATVLTKLCNKYLAGYVLVQEGGKEAVENLIDEGADHLVFTGSGEIGKIVAARCARTLTPVTLELGGKSPVFIDQGLSEDMLDAAVREILETKVAKTGQFCCAHDYALVHENIFDAFVARFQASVQALGPRRNITMIGRRHYEQVKGKLESAGANVQYCPPFTDEAKPSDEAMTLPFTGLLNTAPDSDVWTTEIFGPVMPILKVSDASEAIVFINRVITGKPLIAYCYSEDSGNVEEFLHKISAGNIAINSGPQRLQLNYHCAFGGIGPSGSGVHMWGREALREFSNRKHVIRAKGGFAKSWFSGPPPAPQ